jgi:hypothetical protein
MTNSYLLPKKRKPTERWCVRSFPSPARYKRNCWLGQRRAVIERVIERGNDKEKAEIKRFYGEKAFNKIAEQTPNNSPLND